MEEYKVLVLSTDHLNKQDIINLDVLIRTNMVMARDTGYFIKLYIEPKYTDLMFTLLSTEACNVIRYAIDKGYGMIEFDEDAEIVPIFKVKD